MSDTKTPSASETSPDASAARAAEESLLPKAYDSVEVESRWYDIWQRESLFVASAKAVEEGKKPYVIMMPPPNVTGTLHNGHALFVTLQDVLARYHRMCGDETLWLPGVDHAGIATQAVVERELKKNEGKTRHDIGREAFLERVWAWKEKNGARIVEQMKVLGASADWSRERFTMDETCSAAVKEAFVQLWNEGLIFRGERLVNWDPITRTALSDEEVEHEERKGELWRFAYRVRDSAAMTEKEYALAGNNVEGNESKSSHRAQFPGEDAIELIVATTRPETMLGDTAVAVHPDDERYRSLIGKELVHPFFPDRKVVVVADAYVDPEFGTGAVKITPAHDPNDFEIGQRHQLPSINIFDEDARVNENGGAFMGMDRMQARAAVKAALEELGLYRGHDELTHQVSISQRSGEAIEPMLSRQYFVKAGPLAAKAVAAVDAGDTRILPSSWKKTWEHFMLNIRDWCISRQLWWGHRIPVFYDLEALREAIATDAVRKGGVTALTRAQGEGKSGRDLISLALRSLDEDLVRSFSIASVENLESAQPERYVQEEDVLDTWFSSGLWPFSTLGWPAKTPDLAAFYPGAVLETGFDILFFWVARMMMMGCHFMGKAPFSDVYLHAMVRDAHGKKMSKSEGNAIDPLDVIQGISLEALIEKTKTFPVPPQKLPKVLKGLEKEYPEGIPASGADGLRFSLAALASQGRDVKLSIPRVAGYRAFLNKIWNATRFAMLRVGDEPILPLDEVRDHLSLPDRWILSRLQRATAKIRDAVENYRFDEMANTLYQFFWTELCDWYIELVKGPLQGEDDKSREAARTVLVYVLDTSMRLLHPLCPFQTEEIWQKLPGRQVRFPDVGFCAVAPYPTHEDAWVDASAEQGMDLLVDAITMLRNARQESGLPAQKRVPAVYLTDAEDDRALLARYQTDIKRMAYLESMEIAPRDGYAHPRFAAVNANAQLEVVVPLEGLIDLDAERNRLTKELQKVQKEHAGLEKRLNNAEFLKKAPDDVVEKGKADMQAAAEKMERIQAALERLSAN